MRKLRNDDIPQIEEILVATQAFSADEVSIAIELLETVIKRRSPRPDFCGILRHSSPSF